MYQLKLFISGWLLTTSLDYETLAAGEVFELPKPDPPGGSEWQWHELTSRWKMRKRKGALGCNRNFWKTPSHCDCGVHEKFLGWLNTMISVSNENAKKNTTMRPVHFRTVIVWAKVPTSTTISVICAWDCDVELRAKSNGAGDRCGNRPPWQCGEEREIRDERVSWIKACILNGLATTKKGGRSAGDRTKTGSNREVSILRDPVGGRYIIPRKKNVPINYPAVRPDQRTVAYIPPLWRNFI